MNHDTRPETTRKVPAALTGMAPHSVEAEEAVLVSILIDPETVLCVWPFLPGVVLVYETPLHVIPRASIINYSLNGFISYCISTLVTLGTWI
jgi:hypothetical protein